MPLRTFPHTFLIPRTAFSQIMRWSYICLVTSQGFLRKNTVCFTWCVGSQSKGEGRNNAVGSRKFNSFPNCFFSRKSSLLSNFKSSRHAPAYVPLHSCSSFVWMDISEDIFMDTLFPHISCLVIFSLMFFLGILSKRSSLIPHPKCICAHASYPLLLHQNFSLAFVIISPDVHFTFLLYFLSPLTTK